MLLPAYTCTRCCCEATAADVTLVEAMGWVVLDRSAVELPIPCLCAACRRIAAPTVWQPPGASLQGVRVMTAPPTLVTAAVPPSEPPAAEPGALPLPIS